MSGPDEATLRARLAERGVIAPRAHAVVIDLANDPPLGASARAIAVEEPARVLDGLGAAMVASGARRGVIALRQGTRLGAPEIPAAVRVVFVPPVWPSVGVDRDAGEEGAWVLDGEQALEVAAAAFDRVRAPRRITVVGRVRSPGVVRGVRTIEEAVAAAGGTIDPIAVLLDGGPLGRLADPEDAVRSSVVLVLAPDHALVARARTPLGDWLRRAASACEGCHACTDVCPVSLDGGALAPHDAIITLVTSRDDGTRLAAAAACVGCAVCDLACPSALSPAALVDGIARRLPPSVPRAPRGDAHPDRPGRRMAIDLVLRRLAVEDLALPRP